MKKQPSRAVSKKPSKPDIHNNLLNFDDLEIPSRKNARRLPDKSHAQDNPLPTKIQMSERMRVTSQGFFDIMQQIASVSESSEERKRYYFRGEACSKFTLLPSLLRDNVYDSLRKKHRAASPVELQKKLLDRYRRYTQHLIHSDGDFSAEMWEDFDTLCLAQHHGLPTMLMDWSLNPYISAYFALSDAYRTSIREMLAAYPGITKYWVRVWVMRLKSPDTRPELTVHLEDRKVDWSTRLGDSQMAPSSPLIVVPLVFTRRIAAQAGRFVYCGNMSNDYKSGHKPDEKTRSLAGYSYYKKQECPKDQCDDDGTPKELAWDQLFSLDIEFDISESHALLPKEEKLLLFREQIQKMMSELEFIGFHAGRLFPDLEGWAKYLAEGNL